MISVVFVLGPGTVLLQFRSNRQFGSKIQRLTNISVGGKSGREKIMVLEIISYGQIRKLKKNLFPTPARFYSTGLDLRVHSLLTKVMVRRGNADSDIHVASSDL
jgi:hypothetical protein